MKKLESLNSPKYSLTPEKMGELVGGQQILQSTGRGSLNGVEVSCDLVTYANKTDQRHGIESGPTYGFSDCLKILIFSYFFDFNNDT